MTDLVVTAVVLGVIASGVAIKPPTIEDVREIFGVDRFAFLAALIIWPCFGLFVALIFAA